MAHESRGWGKRESQPDVATRQPLGASQTPPPSPPLSHLGYTGLLAGVAVVVQSLTRVQLFVTSWTIAHQAPVSIGFPRQEHWSGLSFPSPGHLPDPGTESTSPALQAGSLLLSHQGSPLFAVTQTHRSHAYLRAFAPAASCQEFAPLVHHLLLSSRALLRTSPTRGVFPQCVTGQPGPALCFSPQLTSLVPGTLSLPLHLSLLWN